MIANSLRRSHRRSGPASQTPLNPAYRPRHCSGVPADGRISSCFHDHHDETRCHCQQTVLRVGHVVEQVVNGVVHTASKCYAGRRPAVDPASTFAPRSLVGMVFTRAAGRGPVWATPGVTG